MPQFPTDRWIDSVVTTLSEDEQFNQTGRDFVASIRFDFGDTAYVLSVNEGDIIEVNNEPDYVSWDFAVRASRTTWEAILSETPPPQHHDLLAAWLGGEVTLEGDLKTAIQHLRPLKRMIVIFREVTNE